MIPKTKTHLNTRFQHDSASRAFFRLGIGAAGLVAFTLGSVAIASTYLEEKKPARGLKADASLYEQCILERLPAARQHDTISPLAQISIAAGECAYLAPKDWQDVIVKIMKEQRA